MANSEARRRNMWLFLALLVIALPGITLSEWGLTKVQAYADKNANERWAADLYRHVATVYAWTLRPEKACAAYENAERFYRNQERIDEMLTVKLSRAYELEGLPQGKYLALPVYEQIAAEYPETEQGKTARGCMLRIKTMSRP